MHAVPRALAGAAEKHGVTFRYETTVTDVETVNGRATAVITADGSRIPADVVVLNPDLPIAKRDLLPPGRERRLTYSPSCVVLHLGSRQSYSKIAHHNIHFGANWRGTFDEIISYFMFAVVLFIALAVAGLFVLRRKKPDAPYLTPLYPLTPVVYLLLSAALLVLLAAGRPRQALSGLAVVALGLPVYYLVFRGRAAAAAEDEGEGTET
jgi:hypothetical protein